MRPGVTRDIVAKLWRLCDILRDDGITYHESVTELTYLLFLKMLEKTGRGDRLPDGYHWKDLVRREGNDQLVFYRRLLLDLGTTGRGTVQAIFADAQSHGLFVEGVAMIGGDLGRLDQCQFGIGQVRGGNGVALRPLQLMVGFSRDDIDGLSPIFGDMDFLLEK